MARFVGSGLRARKPSRVGLRADPVRAWFSDGRPEAGSRIYLVLLLTITPATKFVSRVGWLRAQAE